MINFDTQIDLEDLEVLSIKDAFHVVDNENIMFIDDISGYIIEIMVDYDGDLWIGNHSLKQKRLVAENAEIYDNNVETFIMLTNDKHLDILNIGM